MLYLYNLQHGIFHKIYLYGLCVLAKSIQFSFFRAYSDWKMISIFVFPCRKRFIPFSNSTSYFGFRIRFPIPFPVPLRHGRGARSSWAAAISSFRRCVTLLPVPHSVSNSISGSASNARARTIDGRRQRKNVLELRSACVGAFARRHENGTHRQRRRARRENNRLEKVEAPGSNIPPEKNEK